MIYVEDLLKMFNKHLLNYTLNEQILGDWYVSFIHNVSKHIENDRPLSTEQGRIVLRLTVKFGKYLVSSGDITQESLNILLKNPVYRKSPYLSANIKKEVRHIGGNYIGFRFKFNELILESIRTLTDISETNIPWFDRDFRIWMVPVFLSNLDRVRNVIAHHRFEMDIQVRDYLALVQCSVGKPAIVVYNDEDDSLIANVCDNELLSAWMKHVAQGDWI